LLVPTCNLGLIRGLLKSKIQSMKLGGSCRLAMPTLGSLLMWTKAGYTQRKQNLDGVTLGLMHH